MKINLSNFETSDVSLFDVSIVQRDVGGGKTEKEDIDCLEEYPTAKSLIISGLNQECFEYLIKHYGNEWYFRIPDKTLKNGCFRRRSKNREDIENKLCDYFIELEKKQQADKEQNTATLKELFYEFMEYKKSKVSGGTINRMMQDWKKFYEPHTEFILSLIHI